MPGDAGSEVFYKLARDLSPQERRDLLAKVSLQPTGEAPLLLAGGDEADERPIEEAYSRIGLLRRFFLWLRHIIVQRDILDLVAEDMLARIGRKIARAYPGMYDHRRETLGPALLRSLFQLGERLQILAAPLRQAIVEERRDYLAFLLSVLLPAEYEMLERASDPRSPGLNADGSEFDIRKQVQVGTRDALSRIEKDSRARLYAVYRGLLFLNELVLFPFSKIAGVEGGPVGEIPAARHRKDLGDLADIIFSLGVRPADEVVGTVIMFHYRDRRSDDGYAGLIEEETRKAAVALDEITRFGRNVPLVDILRLMNRNPAYTPDKLGGGEEWFTVFRQYWEDRADKNISLFLRERRLAEFHEQAARLFGRNVAPERYIERPVGAAQPFRYPKTAAFLLTLAEVLFGVTHNAVLKNILVHGEFYKPQNRAEMTDAFNGLGELSKAIRSVDASLRDDGELGAEIRNVDARPAKKSERDAGIKSVMERADRSMESIIHRGMEDLERMVKVLKGVLFGQSGGAYDTLANLDELGTGDGRAFREKLGEALDAFAEARRLLHLIFDLEHGRD